MAWNFDSNTNNNSTKAEFTKFPVGITRIRVIDAEPHIRWTHWLPALKRSVNCPGKGCPICEIRKQQKANKEPYTHAMGRRFAINIENLETGKVEIMEQGIGFFEDLRDLLTDIESEGKSLIDVIIKVRRRGTGKDDTSYRLDIDSTDTLSSTQKEALTSKKINLAEYFKPHTDEQIMKLLQGQSWEEVMKSDSPNDDEEVEIR